MKKILTSVLALMFAASALQAQKQTDEYLGLPGDNLNLFAVMNLFQDSETLEGFERSLNDPETMINNLDLNGDRLVDYIMVQEYVEDNLHNIVLRVALNRNEFQDVAVFVVEKLRDGSVMVQLIGDEALYGPNYIIEPNYAETPNPGYRGNVNNQKTSTGRNVKVVTTNYYEVASWPVIVYLTRPSYRPWRSSYYYGYYPTYWSPWTPHYYHYYYGYHYNWNNRYYAYYRPWNQPRSVHYRTVYYTRIRNYSPTVVVNVNKGAYKGTYSKPESRRDGEVLYSQRHPRGTTVPTERSAASSSTNNRARQAPATSTQVSRPENKSGDAAGSSPRSTARPTTPSRSQAPAVGNRTGSTTRQGNATEGNTRSNVNTRTPSRNEDAQKSGTPNTERVTRPERNSSTTAPARTTTAPRQSNTNVQRPASQPERRQPAVNQPSEKSSPAPARAAERSPSSNNRQSTTVKPAAQESRSRSTGTTTRQSSPASERSSRAATTSPSKSSSPNEKSSSRTSRRP